MKANEETDKRQKSNQKVKLCPSMSILHFYGGTFFCTHFSTWHGTNYDPCAIHDSWIERDECPLNFTYDEVAEKVKALAEKKGLDVRSVFGINFETNDRRMGIYKTYSDNLIYHTEHFKKNPKMCMDVVHVKITNLNKFLKHGYCWCDGNGKIENSEPFKVGDVGYINLVNLEGKGQSTVVLELVVEDVGVELLDTKLLTASTYEMEKLLKE